MNILRRENERENKDKNMLTGRGMEEDSSSQELFIQYVDSDQRHQGCFKLCMNYKKEEAK